MKLLTIILLSLELSTKATNYYVSTTGDDGHPGTEAEPFLTIQHAADLVNADDIVTIEDGTYTGGSAGGTFISITRGGTSGHPVIFRARTKWGAVLDGQSSVGYCFSISNAASNVHFINLEIKNYYYMGYICNDGSYQSNYITIQGNKIHDIGRYSTTSVYGLNAIYIRALNHHWTINGNLIYNIGRTGPSTESFYRDHAVYTGTITNSKDAAHHNTITYNVIWGCSGVAFNMSSSYDLIANNLIAWSSGNAEYYPPFIVTEGPVRNVTIANNIFYEPPVTNAFAIYNLDSITSVSVKNNIVYGGKMWQVQNAATAATMQGDNFGQTDCENAEVDPKFVNAIKANALNVDFKLQSGSPAINAGLAVGLTSDYLGNPIMGIPDIGAYESQQRKLVKHD